MSDIKHRSVILINENNNLFACLCINGIDKSVKSHVRVRQTAVHNAVFVLVLFNDKTEISLKLFFLHVFASAHVEVQHGIFRPFFLKFFNGKSLEQILLSLEVAF